MRRLIVWLILPSVVIALAAYFALSERALRWVAATAAHAVPGTLTIGRVSGRLIGPMHIQGLSYSFGGDSLLAVESVHLDWRPSAMWRGRLVVVELHADGIDFRSPPRRGASASTPGLPLALDLEDVQLRRVNIHPSGRDTPLYVDAITARARSSGDVIQIHSFTLQSEPVVFQLEGNITVADAVTLDLSIDWQAASPDWPRMAGHGRVSGTLESVSIDQQITAPVQAEIKATLRPSTPELEWEAGARLTRAKVDELNPEWPALILAGELEGKGTLQEFRAHIRLDADTPHPTADSPAGDNGPPMLFTGDVALAVSEDIWQIETAHITLPRHGALIEARGGYRAAPGGELALGGTWKGLAGLLSLQEFAGTNQGTFAFETDFARFALALEGNSKGGQMPELAWSLRGQGTTESFTVSSLEVQLLAGTVSGKGKIQWQPHLQWDLALNAAAMDPGLIAPPLNGAVSFATHSHGEFTAETLAFTLDMTRVRGQIRGHEIRGGARLEAEQGRIRLSKLELSSGQTRLAATGMLEPQWALTWTANVPQLEQWLPASTGAITASGSINGPRDTPNIQLSGRAEQFSLARISGRLLQAEVDLDLGDRRDSQLLLSGELLELDGRALQSLQIEAHGRMANHSVSGSVRTDYGDLSIGLAGGYAAELWQGELRHAALNARALGAWTLEAPTTLAFGRSDWRFGPACWVQSAASLCTNARHSVARGWQIDADAAGIPLEMLREALEPIRERTLAAEGNINAHLSMAIPPTGSPDGTATLHIDAGRLVVNTGLPENILLEADVADGKLQLERGRITVAIQLGVRDMGQISGTLNVPYATLFPATARLAADDQSIQGQFSLEITELSLLSLAWPDAVDPRGSVRGTLSVAGTLNAPEIRGALTLVNGSIVLPRLGISLQDLRVAAREIGIQRYSFEARARSGGGTLSLAATLERDLARGWKISGNIKGENAEIMNTATLRLAVSPDLTLHIEDRRVDLNGDLFVPEAAISLRDIGSATLPSDDIVITETLQDTPRAGRWQIYSRVALKLGPAVHFEGVNIRGRITGDVFLTDAPGQPTSGSGELRIEDGHYSAYGQELDIETGRLIFIASPLENPALDVRAVRHVDTVTAGVNVRGTLLAPEVQITSSPAMPDADALSYLILGRQMSDVSTEEGAILSSAALSLGLAGAEALAQQIGRLFNIEDVRIEATEGSENKSLVVGKYLSPRLYLSYGLGLFERVNSFQIRYRLSDKWAVEAESGYQTGADVLFTMESK